MPLDLPINEIMRFIIRQDTLHYSSLPDKVVIRRNYPDGQAQDILEIIMQEAKGDIPERKARIPQIHRKEEKRAMNLTS